MRITIKPNTYLYLVLLLFLIPLPWLCAWLLAMCMHELCHWLAVKLCGGRIYSLSIGIGGAQMTGSVLSHGKRLFAILSGPVGGILPVFLGRWFPRLALCCWILSVYNLLPLTPLDGGRALQILFQERTFRIIERAFLLVSFFLGLYCLLCLHLGWLPLLLVAGLFLRNGKRPCKERIFKVQ